MLPDLMSCCYRPVLVRCCRYQTINMESKAFKSKVAPFVGPMQLFKALGFVKLDDEQKLTLPK